jgi:hypothetical protein
LALPEIFYITKKESQKMAFELDKETFKMAYRKYASDVRSERDQIGRIRPKGVDIFEWLMEDREIYEAAAEGWDDP